MKKIILSVAALFAFGFANAQEVKFGAKAGVNFSTFTGDAEDVDGKVGFQVGAFAEIKISDKFSVQPELMYTTLGAKFDEMGTTFTQTVDYIVLPVMAKFYVADAFSLEAGPQIGFLVGAKIEADGESVDVKEFYNSTDFGLNFGAGYDFTENISAGLRYTLGLSNIAKDSGDESIQNSNFALALAYKF
jgi:opacity protein-like surface antigen